MYDTIRTTVGVIAAVLLALGLLGALLVAVERRYGSQGTAMLLLGIFAGVLFFVARWGLA
jgi:hypothetical protein